MLSRVTGRDENDVRSNTSTQSSASLNEHAESGSEMLLRRDSVGSTIGLNSSSLSSSSSSSFSSASTSIASFSASFGNASQLLRKRRLEITSTTHVLGVSTIFPAEEGAKRPNKYP